MTNKQILKEGYSFTDKEIKLADSIWKKLSAWRLNRGEWFYNFQNKRNMDRQIVDSSNLASVGYEPQTQTLEVEFKHGGIYQYYNVPKSVYEGLMNASSHGQYFDRNIKRSDYRYSKVG